MALTEQEYKALEDIVNAEYISQEPAICDSIGLQARRPEVPKLRWEQALEQKQELDRRCFPCLGLSTILSQTVR